MSSLGSTGARTRSGERFTAVTTAIVRRLPFGLAEVIPSNALGFAIINALTFSVDLACLTALHGGLGWPVPLAITLSYVAAFALSFVLNRALNFRSHGELGREVASYIAAVVVNFSALILGVGGGLAALGLDYRVSRVIAGVCEAVFMYAAMRWLVFRDRQSHRSARREPACNDGQIMGPIQRAVRRALNPMSTRFTMLVQGGGTRRALAARRAAPTRGRAPNRPGRAARTPDRSSWGGGAIRADRQSVVPDVFGLSWDNAREVLYRSRLVPVGPPLTALGWQAVVVGQRPDPGTLVAVGSPVTVWVEQGPGPAGDREPRRPKPSPLAASGMLDEETDEAVG